MRWVDIKEVEELLTPEWIDKVRNAERMLEAAQDEDARRIVFKSAASVWQELKPVLESIMNKKCWYCETKNFRSDNAVDHFRPKSRYWWLAFRFENLRFSCTFCNSRRIDELGGTDGGKGAEFPIVGVLAKGKADSLDAEEAVLLDPCTQQDPNLLWFDDTGRPVPNPEFEHRPGVSDRVKASIHLYHLDFRPLIAARRRAYLDVLNACASGDAALRVHKETGNQAAYQDWWERVAEVNRLISPKSPHSAAAKCAALGLRVSSPTAEQALAVR
jgi:uncharacterized protein (TIGR02646 family)